MCHVLHRASYLIISRRCFKENFKAICENEKKQNKQKKTTTTETYARGVQHVKKSLFFVYGKLWRRHCSRRSHCKFPIIASAYIPGCFKALPKEVTFPRLQETYDRICSNIYNQLVVIEEHVHPTKRIDADLMMEQCVVCGLMGYNEFLTPQRLRRVLKWQRSSGCYGDISDERNLTWKGRSRKTMRKLLTKKDLPGIWLVHKSCNNGN